MITLFSGVLALHVLAATFCAGSTFTLARTGGKNAAELFRPQMGAATVAVLAGAFLWLRVSGGGGGRELLGLGALSALLAAGVQGVLVGRVRRRLATDPPARERAALGHRIAAGLLAVSVVCMVLG